MAGMYIHIPYCKKACHYCNFHFSTTLNHLPEMVSAICREIGHRHTYLEGAPVETIYFGGGTPSLLSIEDLRTIFDVIQSHFQVVSSPEITIEANPDDLRSDYLAALKSETPVNRLSIGIQSFFEEDLRWMNRAHSALESRICVENALKTGFDNLSLDLIYGIPDSTDEQWSENMRTAFDYGVNHLSAYCLTVEEGTALHHFVQKGKAQPVDDEKATRQFEMLMDYAEHRGFDHYEISNFGRQGHYARHNSNYWHGVPYLGIGPAAHSYNGTSRLWNIAHNAHYLQHFPPPFEQEILTPNMRYNEYVMTALRTIWGVKPAHLSTFDTGALAYFEREVRPFLDDGHVQYRDGIYTLTKSGKFLADFIAGELFMQD